MKSCASSSLGPREALRVLNAVSGLGNRRIQNLLSHFGSPSAVLSAAPIEFAQVAGIPQAAALNLKTFDFDLFLATDDQAVQKHHARIVTVLDPEYPSLLASIDDAPIVLYVKGVLPSNDDACIGIVGGRNATLYGLQVAERFAMELADLGAVIVSGLARGIDAAAHKGALKARGRTVGVLGCGLDIVYPLENAELYGQMEQHGCVISEFPFGTLPMPFNFPRRNRIVSGLSLGVVVVEAKVKSGALITAQFAVEQGREVFAVPGRIDNRLSDGPHALIRQGAKVAMTVEDILEEIPIRQFAAPGQPAPDPEVKQKLDPDEELVWRYIKEGPVSLDQLENLTGRAPSVLMGPLLSLQIKRRIVERPGKIYEAKR